jgi:hypothetical protein
VTFIRVLYTLRTQISQFICDFTHHSDSDGDATNRDVFVNGGFALLMLQTSEEAVSSSFKAKLLRTLRTNATALFESTCVDVVRQRVCSISLVFCSIFLLFCES